MMVKKLSLVLASFIVPLIAWVTAPLMALVARTGFGVDVCRRWGFHPIRLHYYQPIPEYEKVDGAWFNETGHYPGIKIDQKLIRDNLSIFKEIGIEADWRSGCKEDGRYDANNESFGFCSAALLHSFIRHYRPKKVIEIGGGHSSLVTLAALSQNKGPFEFVCIEPYPSTWLKNALSSYGDKAKLIKSPVEKLSRSMLADLSVNDILFIDSSHCVRLNSDVNFLFLEVLPLLKPGVIVHIHDIYLPFEYAKIHFTGQNKIFWNEQYLLAALLSGSSDFEVLIPGYYVNKEMETDFSNIYPNYQASSDRPTSSFWIRRK